MLTDCDCVRDHLLRTGAALLDRESEMCDHYRYYLPINSIRRCAREQPLLGGVYVEQNRDQKLRASATSLF